MEGAEGRPQQSGKQRGSRLGGGPADRQNEGQGNKKMTHTQKSCYRQREYKQTECVQAVAGQMDSREGTYRH